MVPTPELHRRDDDVVGRFPCLFAEALQRAAVGVGGISYVCVCAFAFCEWRASLAEGGKKEVGLERAISALQCN